MSREINIDGGVSGPVPYVPEYDGIRRAWLAGRDDCPVTVWIRPVTAGQITERAVAQLDAERRKRLLDGDQSSLAAEQRADFAAQIERVENYSICDVPVVTGEDLWDRGEAPIRDECAMAIVNLSALEAGFRKPLASQSDSSNPVTSPSDGTVGSA